MPPKDPWYVFAGFAVLYMSMAANTAQGGDASEFMTVAATGGVPHPPGYPLFSALTWLSVHALPVGNVAWKASIVASLQAAAALGLLNAALRELTGRLPALLAVGALGLSLHFWRYATVAEVFAGGALTAALLVFVCTKIARGLSGPRAALYLGLALSSGVANHHTVVTLFPLGLLALFHLLPREPVAAGRTLLVGALALVPGFAAYGLFLLPGGGWRWGDTSTLSGLLHHVLRRDYGTFSLGIVQGDVSPWDHPLYWASQVPVEFVGVFALLAVVGLASIATLRGRDRQLAVAIAASIAVSGPLFLSAFNLPTVGSRLVIAARFHILPNVLLTCFVALGAAAVLRRTSSRWVPGALFAGLLLSVALHGPNAGHRSWTVLEDYLRNVYATVEPDAVLIGNGDPSVFGSLYLQHAEGLRPDVVYIEPTMAGHAWYVDRLKAQHPGFRWDNTVPQDAVLEIIDQNLDRRPVYVMFQHYRSEHYEGRLPPAWPVGAVLMKVGATGQDLPPPAAVEAELLDAMERHTIRSRVDTLFRSQSTWEYNEYDQYAFAFDTLAMAFERTGDPGGAARNRARAAELSPYRFGALADQRH